jgi:hypothetical protein
VQFWILHSLDEQAATYLANVKSTPLAMAERDMVIYESYEYLLVMSGK